MARPKEFSREEVLNKAMILFWHKGFENSSMQDLTKAMNMSRSSIYEAFGNKEGLFLEVLDYYSEFKMMKRTELLKQEFASPKEALIALFDNLIDGLYESSQPDGCLLTETASNLESVNQRVADFVKSQTQAIHHLYRTLVFKARQGNDLKSNLDDEMIAYMLLSFHEGTIILSGLKDDLDLQKQMIRDFIGMI